MFVVLMLLGACGPKATPEPTAAPVAETAPVVAEPTLVAEPEPEPLVSNADFHAVIDHADGRVIEGRVVRVERGVDWHATEGWTDHDLKRTVTLAGGGTEIEASWSDIRELTVSYADRSGIDCSYDSSFTPWVYTCVLKTTGSARTADGEQWTPASRYRWRFHFADGTHEEFHVHKLPARAPDDSASDDENPDMYVRLQGEVLGLADAAVTRIRITPGSAGEGSDQAP